MRRRGGVWGLSACLLLALSSCDRGATAEPASGPDEVAQNPPPAADRGRPTRAAAREEVEQEGLLIGEYRLAEQAIVDGDTIRVLGVEGSVRLLSIDTEEKPRGKAERAAIRRDFKQYLQTKRGNAVRPRKAGTPMGEKATKFAEAFFRGAKVVRLERDDPKNIRGHYGRLLAYAFVERQGRWTSYNVEAVRAGMSPYFTKYGYSHRFHNQLTHAESEARQAKRGIWNPKSQGYGDYEERRAWWNARADFIRAFEHRASARDDYIELAHWDADAELEQRLGQEVTVMSIVEKIQHFKGLVRVSLGWKQNRDFPVIFFDETVFRRSGVERFVKEPVAVRGTVERYEKGTYRTLQIVVQDPSQIELPRLPWPDDTNVAGP